CLKWAAGAGNGQGARARAFVIGAPEARQDPNVVTGTFHINNHPIFVLFDSGADRSFVSKDFRPLFSLKSSKLFPAYEVELANGKLLVASEVVGDCIICLGDHSFSIDLIPMPLGSFDIVVGMDWLANNHTYIVCFKKMIRIPLENGESLLTIDFDK
ncbi:MAG: hypothetical protein Q8886_02875, partial [Candidatus Phytoplasma australasiaticum]|nr:hypothetical protein [Candidatus Phytoplasma australasiaticum]